MKNKGLLLFVGVVCLMSFIVKDTYQIPRGWPEPIYPIGKNEPTIDKVYLGRMLFYDPILSVNQTISCASCHSQFNAFTHADHALSHGIYDSIGTRNSPALMNLAWQPYFMWDGAINHLDMQALAPISHPKEMGESLAHVLQKLGTSKRYKSLFYKAWRDSIPTTETVLKSLSAFMLTLVSNQSKYDSMQLGLVTFTDQEERGYSLFKKHCNSCHTEPLFTNYQFETNGIKVNAHLNDFGRFAVTHYPNDSFRFKIPTLRNVEYSFPYMHDGRFESLNEVIQFYASSSSIVDKTKGKTLHLDAKEKVDLHVFLLTLTDKQFLFNRSYGYPMELNTQE